MRKEYVGAWRKIIGAKLLTASSDGTISTGKKRYLSFSCRDVCRAIKEALERESYAAVRGEMRTKRESWGAMPFEIASHGAHR